MFKFLEIKYLAIQWTDKETVFKLEESNDTLTIEQTDNGTYGDGTVQTVTYPKVHHYLGFSFEGEVSHTPYFELSNGKREYLVCLKSPKNNKTWWIQNSGWDKKNKRYYSELYRTVGKLSLVVQNRSLEIENNDLEFTVKELEHYLSDFKNDLWLLILDTNNPAKAKISKEVPNIFQEDVLEIFKNFVDVSINLIKNPNMFLSERQNLLPIKKVKPIPRTFRELIQKPNRKYATGRDFYESYDTSENRYIHYCVSKTLYLLQNLDRLAKNQVSSYQQKIDDTNEWKDELLNQEVNVIDKDVYQNEIDTIKSQILSIVTEFGKLKINIEPKECHEFHRLTYHNFSIRLSYKLKEENGYFINELDGISRDDFKKRYGADTIVFKINDPDYANEDFSRITSLNFAGFCTYNRYIKESNNSTGNQSDVIVTDIFKFNKITWIDFDINNIYEYTKLANKLKEMETRKVQLEEKNWTEPLNYKEKQEFNKEASILERRTEIYKQAKKQISTVSTQLPTQISILKQVLNFFTTNNVKKQANSPNSMVFIQNPLYAGCKKFFKQIMDVNGLDQSLFDAMLEIDEIGLVNISNLYEKWCLIKTIQILKNIYGFVLQEDWQSKLIQSVQSEQYNISLMMKCENTSQSIKTTYEKVLTSGRRPDIVIDLTYDIYSVSYDSNSKNYIINVIKTVTKRLVLDAKFQNLNQNSHDSLINQLYFPEDESDRYKPNHLKHKNYSEDGHNQVFIIHPKPKVIEKPTSPLKWGRFCDYGQSNEARHKYGGVFLSPSLNHPQSIDNLQRLIGMFLQQNDQKDYVEGRIFHNMSCIACGNSENNSLDLSYSQTQGKNDIWTLKCYKCSQLTIQSVCFNCKNIIFKNGLKWAYHRTRAEQVSNVVCPDCESFL
ncbi:DUF2357 domain-containing protein [Psychrobacter sp. NC44]|uniref:DUF2357 domain-containing protein n=1 Tax=Psychrobacter sp. NC44 TaxID=2774130 RepID=UPI00191B0AC5|nr:DUF2357 domain-containing protein [Psychrobacter sp. NC44]